MVAAVAEAAEAERARPPLGEATARASNTSSGATRAGGVLGARPVYTEVEHTADVGIELTARTLRTAFENAAAAMFDLMCPLDAVDGREVRTVCAEARSGDIEALLVRWLAELLYLHERDRMLLSEFSVLELDAEGLIARVAGEPFDPERHSVTTDIKAPTYHELVIRETGDHWMVRVIFDT